MLAGTFTFSLLFIIIIKLFILFLKYYCKIIISSLIEIQK